MTDKNLINQLAPPDYASLLAVFLSWAAIILLLKHLFFASLGVAIFALVADMLDGWLARRGSTSPFGKYLDSFVDVILYLLYPALFLYLLGLDDAISLVTLGIFIAAGVLRLARFTADGFEEDENQRYYIGMPVFWNLLWLYVVFLVSTRWPVAEKELLLVAGLLLVCWLMVSSIKFPKPVGYGVLLPLLVVLALGSIILNFQL